MRLRPVTSDDVEAYVAMRCDAGMMAELGGPQRPEEMPGKVARDIEAMAAGRAWTFMIIIEDGETGNAAVAGTVSLYRHPGTGESEIGWMVLPQFQGRGLATAAARELLALAAREPRWGSIHAWPPATNAASNGVCRSLGFTFVGEETTPFAGRVFHTNHWVGR
jgi:RimJ/RimL family protein N-acetyltransferase